jgi:hypothetical protein
MSVDFLKSDDVGSIDSFSYTVEAIDSVAAEAIVDVVGDESHQSRPRVGSAGEADRTTVMLIHPLSAISASILESAAINVVDFATT